MQIKKIPQFNPRDFLVYTFEEKKMIVNYNGVEEIFDFNSLDLSEDKFVEVIPEDIDLNPFRSIHKEMNGIWVENGEIKAKLVEYYSQPNKYSGENGVIKTEWEVV